MKKIKVRLTFTESVLGTSPANDTVYRDFIGSKAPDAATVDDEVAALGVEAVAEKGMTIFPKMEDGKPFLYDYQVKGFFKGACAFLRAVPDSKSAELKAYKKAVDGACFVSPRRIPIMSADGEPLKIGKCERPLRASTPQGERVSLACSEEIPAGSFIEFEVLLLNPKAHERMFREWMNYGQLSGIGQWRNSGRGRFTWEEISAEDVPFSL